MVRRIVAAAALVIVAGVAAWGQPLPPLGQQMDQSPQDKYNVDPSRCPGADANSSGAIGYDKKKRQFICAPTPAAAGGGCTPVACTRSSATVYTCAGSGTIQSVRVGNTTQVIKGACGGLNDATVSASTVTFCYDVDVAVAPSGMTVQACRG